MEANKLMEILIKDYEENKEFFDKLFKSVKKKDSSK